MPRHDSTPSITSVSTITVTAIGFRSEARINPFIDKNSCFVL